jgi:hypothetical protein
MLITASEDYSQENLAQTVAKPLIGGCPCSDPESRGSSLKTVSPHDDVTEEARRILRTAEEKKVTLRLVGGLAIRFHCHGQHASHLREYHDVDVLGLADESEMISSVFRQLGYSPNFKYNLLYGGSRLQFVNDATGKNVDVFLDKFSMDHRLDFRQRLRLDELTIPVTDLLLTKLQMARLGEKDVKDIIAILEDHELGRKDDREILNIGYVAKMCASDWGLYKTVTDNLRKMSGFIDQTVQDSAERTELAAKLGVIRRSVEEAKKGMKWRIRGLVGERIRWYEPVELGEGEAY